MKSRNPIPIVALKDEQPTPNIHTIRTLYPELPRIAGLKVVISNVFLRFKIDGPRGTLNIWSYDVTFKNSTSSRVSIVSRSWVISSRLSDNTTTVKPIQMSSPLSPGGKLLVLEAGQSAEYSAGIASFESSVVLAGGFIVQCEGTYGSVAIKPHIFALKSKNIAPQPLAITSRLTRDASKRLASAIAQYASEIRYKNRAILRVDKLLLSPNDESLISAFLFYDAHLNPSKTRVVDLSPLMHPSELSILLPFASTDHFMVRNSRWHNVGRLYLSPYVEFTGNREYYESICLSSNVPIPIFNSVTTGDVTQFTHFDRMKQNTDENALIDALFDCTGVDSSKRTGLKAEIRIAIARTTRPQWNDRHEFGTELSKLSAPSFLKRVHAQDIAHDGTVNMALLRSVDPDLMESVGAYVRLRRSRGQDMGDAKGLILDRTSGRPKKPRAATPPDPA